MFIIILWSVYCPCRANWGEKLICFWQITQSEVFRSSALTICVRADRKSIFFFYDQINSCCCWLHVDAALVVVSVWRTGVPVDGEPEAGGELQPPPGADRKTCGAVRQLTEDWPADGFPQRVLRSSQTSGTVARINGRISPTVGRTSHFLLPALEWICSEIHDNFCRNPVG